MAPPARKRIASTWQVASPFEGAGALARQGGTHPLVAQVLANRGITDPDDVKRFLNPKLSDLHDPAELAGVPAAARRIATPSATARRSPSTAITTSTA